LRDSDAVFWGPTHTACFVQAARELEDPMTQPEVAEARAYWPEPDKASER